MRNPVATPASVIIGILLLGFFAIVGFCYLTTGKTMYVLESEHWTYVWERAFLIFTDAFIALQCAGALIAYSLFLGVPVFFNRKALFRYLSSVIVTLVILAALFIVCREGFAPGVREKMRQTRSLGLFSDALYRAALDRQKAGDNVTALEYLRFSLIGDGRNQDKITARSALLARLTAPELAEYQARTTGRDRRDEFDPAAALQRARAALDAKDYARADSFALAVLEADPSNPEAMRIAGIAGEKSYRATTIEREAQSRTLFARKKEAVAALQSGKAGSTPDLIRAYYLLADLHRVFPLDANTVTYLREAEDRLPAVSFFIADAALASSFHDLADDNIVFFNSIKGNERELVSIESMVAVGDAVYFKNIEVAGIGAGGRLLYHYLAPYGKRIGSYINLNGLDRIALAKKMTVRTLDGLPPFDPAQGIKLDDASVGSVTGLQAHALSRMNLEELGLGQLFSALPPLRRTALFSDFARLDELMIREIVYRVGLPLLLVILSLFCFSIGLTQNARYLSAVPKGIYLWVLVIPFVMLAVMALVLFLYRMGVVFLYDALGPAIGIVVVAALHVFFLILGLLFFSGKIGASLRRQ